LTGSSKFSGLDALLLLMTLIWGTNYSIVKSAFREIDPQAFNAVRMIIGSSVFVAIIVGIRRWPAPGTDRAGDPRTIASIFRTPAPITPQDWLGLAGLGLVGHSLYQFLFIGGLARTSVANSSLILAATPVVIALLAAVLGQERVGRLHWAGAALSMAGIYIVVGHGASLGRSELAGDLMMVVAVFCWAAYTLGARTLMMRHSPVGVTGISMALGTLVYAAVMWPRLLAVEWRTLSGATWAAIVYSALFALCVAYTIWYVAVRRIGGAGRRSTRTSSRWSRWRRPSSFSASR
jgi:drug/metabolite transporter (DMT)-like permease